MTWRCLPAATPCAFRLALTAGIALLTACSAGRPPLNSELIAQRYGNYAIEVLQDDGKTRRSMLYSVTDGRQICRTYAVVTYESLSDADATLVAAEKAAIRHGASMGSTFAAGGWTVVKESIQAGVLPAVPAEHPIARMMALEEPTGLAYYAYRFVVTRNAHQVFFATIGEVYHPDFVDLDELRRRYTLPARSISPQGLRDIESALLAPY